MSSSMLKVLQQNPRLKVFRSRPSILFDLFHSVVVFGGGGMSGHEYDGERVEASCDAQFRQPRYASPEKHISNNRLRDAS